MTDRLDNPELDRLVASLNRDPTQRPPAADPEAQLHFPVSAVSDGRTQEGGGTTEPLLGGRLEEVRHGVLWQALRSMTAARASDLLVLRGLPWIARVDGKLAPLQSAPDPAEDVGALFASHLDARHRRALNERGGADFTLRLDQTDGAAWRFRVNLHRQRGELAASIRALPQNVPTLQELNLPPGLGRLVEVQQGLIVVCGPTGSGKSSTLAALVGEINRRRPAHVITIEDPVEYLHSHDRSLIEQIEIGRDAPSYAEGLRSALRQDPDVILVGEMRDLETISTAITAGETGHLILATLHTPDVVQSIHRMVDVFPEGAQEQIRHQLSLSLHAIVSQQLVVRRDGAGRVPAVEVLHATYPVRHHIRKRALEKLYNEVVLGKRHGMITFEQSLADLVVAGTISADDARARARRPDELESLLS